jgi:hypothetical protein
MQIKMFEVVESSEVIEQENRNNFTLGHFTGTIAMFLAVFRQLGHFC